MTEMVSKRTLRRTVESLNTVSCGIYSTANIKSTDEYRMSLPWNGSARHCEVRKVPAKVWAECDAKRDKMMAELLTRLPQLKGHITTKYHIGAGIYLSLRVSNKVLMA